MTKTLDELAAEIYAAKKAYWEALPKIVVTELEARSLRADGEWFKKRSLFLWVGNELASVGWAEQREGDLYNVWGYHTDDNEILLAVVMGDENIGVHECAPPLPLTDA